MGQTTGPRGARAASCPCSRPLSSNGAHERKNAFSWLPEGVESLFGVEQNSREASRVPDSPREPRHGYHWVW